MKCHAFSVAMVGTPVAGWGAEVGAGSEGGGVGGASGTSRAVGEPGDRYSRSLSEVVNDRCVPMEITSDLTTSREFYNKEVLFYEGGLHSSTGPDYC